MKSYIKYGDDSYYLGEWQIKSEKRHGRGIQLWKDKSKYYGQWKNDKPNGFGKFELSDGDYYIGEWLDGKANGKGKFVKKKWFNL